MNRLARNMITGGMVATVFGLMMRRSPRNYNMLSRTMDMMGRSTRYLRNMARTR